MTTIQSLERYRENPAISQSELKFLLGGKNNVRKPSLTMLIGSYVDCVLLTPHLKDELYWVVDVNRPTQKIVELCNSFYNWLDKDLLITYPNGELTEHIEEIEQWIDTIDYYSNRPKTRVEKFIKEASEWWNVLVKKEDRELITTVEELETELLVMNLKNDPELEWLWKGEFQKDFYWTEDEVDCKGLGDICLPDVYVDLKFTQCDNIKDWMKVCSSLNYPFQMAFYKSGLNVNKCYWLVVSKNWYQLVPVNELMLQIGKWGYNKYEKIRIGKVEQQLEKKFYGYKDGLSMIKESHEQTIDQLYIECITGQ